jgi:adenylate cyclase class IV
MAMIEVEKRALLNEIKYNELTSFLESKAKSLGEDDKDVSYFIYEDKLLKVVHNISHGNAKVSLKNKRLGDGASSKEVEVYFDQNSYSDLKSILKSVCVPKQIIEGVQKRKNFFYKDCTISLKWSKDWGYHIEVERTTEDESEIGALELSIHAVEKDFDIHYLTDEETRELQRNIEVKAKT